MLKIRIEELKNKLRNKRFTILLCLLITHILFLFLGFVTRTYVKRNEAYYTKNKVVLYISKYKALPYNYIHNDKLKDGGYQPGGIIYTYQVHKYEGAITTMTKKESLIECDIEYPVYESTRGTKRIVFSTDYKEFYYTNNHYESFKRVRPWSINGFSNISFYISTIVLGLGGAYVFYIIRLNRKDDFEDGEILY